MNLGRRWTEDWGDAYQSSSSLPGGRRSDQDSEQMFLVEACGEDELRDQDKSARGPRYCRHTSVHGQVG